MQAPPIAAAAVTIDAASLDAKLNNVRAAWEEVERRRARKAEELKTLRDRLGAAEEQRAMLLRNDTVEQPAIVLDQARTLQLRADKIEQQIGEATTRWKSKIAEAEATFRGLLFGEQLPLLLPEGTSDPGDVVDEGTPTGAVLTLDLDDGRHLRVGGPAMIHGAGAHRPGIIRELTNRGEHKRHAAVVTYDDDETQTPAHVMAHQCHPLDGLIDTTATAKPSRGSRRKKGSDHDTDADAIAGEVTVDDDDADAAPKKRGRTPRPLGLGDRVRLVVDDGGGGEHLVDGVGTIEAMVDGDKASVRWDHGSSELVDVPIGDLRRASRGRKPTGNVVPLRQPKRDELSATEEAARADIEESWSTLPTCIVCGDEVAPDNVGATQRYDGSPGVTCRACTGDDPA